MWISSTFEVSLGGEGVDTGVEDELDGARLQTKNVALPGNIALLSRSKSKSNSLVLT